MLKYNSSVKLNYAKKHTALEEDEKLKKEDNFLWEKGSAVVEKNGERVKIEGNLAIRIIKTMNAEAAMKEEI